MQEAVIMFQDGYEARKSLSFHYRKRFFRFCFLLVLVIPGLVTAAAVTDSNRQYKVLVLNSHHPNYSWTSWIMEGIEATIKDSGRPIDTNIEYMYSKQFQEPEYIEKLYKIYKYKYADKKFDVIISTDDMAFEFLLRYRDELFPGVPFAFCGIDRLELLDRGRDEDLTGIVEGKTGLFTIELVHRLHPGARKIILLNDGLLLWFRPWVETLDDLRRNFSGRAELVDLSVKNRKLIEAIDEIHTVYDDAPVVLFECFRDAERTYTYNDVTKILRERCNAPIYVITKRWLDRGVAVGGNIADGFRQGRIATEMALRILDGEKASDIPVMLIDPEGYMFDYRQLKRFDIPLWALPENSVIINQPQSFFYQYKKRILIFTAVVAGLVLITISLLLTYIWRRRVEKKLLRYQERLKSLTLELTLTEDRQLRRIATDLHEHISQSLIRAKLNVESLRQSVSSKEFIGGMTELCENLDHAIQATRSLTFDLGSPVLYELGFEAAVGEWLDEQVRQKHGIVCEFSDAGRPIAISDDIAVILFRMVRELLVNIVKHSHANSVKVAIDKIDGEIHVSVEDDGVGFEPSEIASMPTNAGGYGIFSIRERLEQLTGRLEINSAPTIGTKIKIIVPVS